MIIVYNTYEINNKILLQSLNKLKLVLFECRDRQ